MPDLEGTPRRGGVGVCVSEGGVCSDFEPTREQGHGIDSGEKSQRAGSYYPQKGERLDSLSASLGLPQPFSLFLISSSKARVGCGGGVDP